MLYQFMIGSRRTDLQYLDLDHLIVDDRSAVFTSATITVETVHTKGLNDWTSLRPRWYGQIVSDVADGR